MPKKADKTEDLHNLLVSHFEDFISSTQTNRELCERDRDYNDHIQWTSSELAELKKRKQQPSINNVIRKKMNFLRGYERKIRTDPKAYPRTPNHEDDAEAATDALRYIADNTEFDVARSSFWDNYIIEGTGAVEVLVSKDKKREIQTQHIQWDRLYWDVHSRNNDFSDASYTGIVIWDDVENVKANFPDSEDVIDNAMDSSSSESETFEDKPTTKWSDHKRKRVRICQEYFKHKGEWHLAFFTKSGFLVEPMKAPWLDEDGKPENGMIMQSAYVDRNGNRYGEPRFMIEIQDGINHRESKMVHLVSQRQTFGNNRAFPEGVAKQKRELAKPDGHIELAGNAEMGRDFGVLPTGDMAQGQFQLLQEAKQSALDNGSSQFQGAAGGDGQSGRAIIAMQNGQQIEINPLVDGKRQFEKRVYNAWWNRVRQFWTDERWIRVTDNEQNQKFVGLNKPVTVAEAIEEEGGVVAPAFAQDPRLQAVSRVDNQPAEIEVDIIIEDAPDVVTIQQEEFRNLIDLAGVGIMFDKADYIKASNLRNKADMLKTIEGASEAEQQAAQAQAAAAQKQAESFAQLQAEAVAAAAEKDGASALNQQAQARKNEQEAIQTGIENEQLEQGIKL